MIIRPCRGVQVSPPAGRIYSWRFHGSQRAHRTEREIRGGCSKNREPMSRCLPPPLLLYPTWATGRTVCFRS